MTDLAAQVAVAWGESAAGQPARHPGRVGMRRRDDVVDVVQSPPGGLFLEPVDDEPPDAGPAPVPADQERDLGVTPFAVQPAVAGHLAVVPGDMPPFVG